MWYVINAEVGEEMLAADARPGMLFKDSFGRLCEVTALVPLGYSFRVLAAAGGWTVLTYPPASSSGTGDSGDGQLEFDWGAEPVTQPTDAPIKEYCMACKREWSKELDAYWGTDPMGRVHCAPCRSKKGIR